MRTRHLARHAGGRSGDDSGVTLGELLVVMTLMGVVLAAAYTLTNALSGWTNRVDARVRASDEARLLMDRMTRELRQAVEVTDGGGAFTQALPRQCAFYSDIDRDGSPEIVSYRVAGNVLYRGVAEPSRVVPPYTPYGTTVESVLVRSIDALWTGSAFTYYDRSDPPVQVSSGTPEDISAVSLRLVNSVTVGGVKGVADRSTWVKVRSVKNAID
jgi:prepilin-type N-terminal cleavage/methylation domain-containing protein